MLLIDQYSSAVTAASTLVLAIITVLLWIENRSLRKAGTTPQVVAYLEPHIDGTGAIEFVLSNVGKGPAFDVTFDLDCDEADFEAHKVYLTNDRERTPMSVLPQDSKVRSLFGVSFVLYGKVGEKSIEPLKPFKVCIEYKDIFGRRRKTERRIDIRQFAGLHGILAKSNEAKAAKSLENIERHIGTIARQTGNFSAFVDVSEVCDQYVKVTPGDPRHESE